MFSSGDGDGGAAAEGDGHGGTADDGGLAGPLRACDRQLVDIQRGFAELVGELEAQITARGGHRHLDTDGAAGRDIVAERKPRDGHRAVDDAGTPGGNPLPRRLCLRQGDTGDGGGDERQREQQGENTLFHLSEMPG